MRNTSSSILLIVLLLATVLLALAAWQSAEHQKIKEGPQRVYEVLVAESAAPIVVATTDGSPTIIEYNTAARKLFGMPREDVIGKPLELLLPKLKDQIADGSVTTYTRIINGRRVIVENREVGETILSIITVDE